MTVTRVRTNSILKSFQSFAQTNEINFELFCLALGTGLHSDLFLGSSDQLSSSPQYESNEELHQGMLSALADDIINLVMSLDVVHFKTMLDKSRSTVQEQDDELRRRQELIMDLECKVS